MRGNALWVPLILVTSGCFGAEPDATSPTGAEPVGAPGSSGPVAVVGPTPVETPSNPTWRAHEPAPTARTEVAVAPLGATLCAIGGFATTAAGSLATQTVECFDASKDSWGVGPNYPVPIHHAAAVSFGGIIYVFGGYTTSQFVPTGLAYRYAPQIKAWERLADMPLPRGAHAAGLIDYKVYVAGGVGIDGQLLSAVHVYDISAQTWSTAPDLPTPRDHVAGAVVDGLFYVVGGRSQSLTTNKATLEAYDPEAKRWMQLRDMPTPRGGLTAANYSGQLVAVGGERPGETHAEAEAYDPAANSWKRLPDLPTPRHGLGSAVWQDRLYVLLGGPKPGFTVSGIAESLGP